MGRRPHPTTGPPPGRTRSPRRAISRQPSSVFEDADGVRRLGYNDNVRARDVEEGRQGQELASNLAEINKQRLQRKRPEMPGRQQGQQLAAASKLADTSARGFHKQRRLQRKRPEMPKVRDDSQFKLLSPFGFLWALVSVLLLVYVIARLRCPPWLVCAEPPAVLSDENANATAAPTPAPSPGPVTQCTARHDFTSTS